MIFWIFNLEKPGGNCFMSHLARVEAMCYFTQSIRAVLYHQVSNCGSLSFVKHVAIVDNNRTFIKIHSNYNLNKPADMTRGKRGGATTYCIPLLGEMDDLNRYPKRFAIETENIDLIRELILRGHTISWFNPDIARFYHYFPQFNFEHLFLFPFMDLDVVTLSGEIKTLRKYMRGWRRYMSLPFKKKIGFSLKGAMSVVDIYRAKMNKKRRYYKWKPLVAKKFFATYYNMLTITYMVCKRSTATNVKKKTVPKD